MSPAKMDVKAKVRSKRTRSDVKMESGISYRVIMTVIVYAKNDEITINMAKPNS